MMRRLVAGFWVGLLLVPALAFADVALLKSGDAVPNFQLNDQHDKPYAITADTRAIIFTADKSAGDMINGLLKQHPADYLSQRKAVYIADISAMPGFITSMVAMPKMRDYAYRIAIGAEKEQTAMLPRAEDSVTVISLENGKVQQIQQFKEREADKLAALLQGLPIEQKP